MTLNQTTDSFLLLSSDGGEWLVVMRKNHNDGNCLPTLQEDFTYFCSFLMNSFRKTTLSSDKSIDLWICHGNQAVIQDHLKGNNQYIQQKLRTLPDLIIQLVCCKDIFEKKKQHLIDKWNNMKKDGNLQFCVDYSLNSLQFEQFLKQKTAYTTGYLAIREFVNNGDSSTQRLASIETSKQNTKPSLEKYFTNINNGLPFIRRAVQDFIKKTDIGSRKYQIVLIDADNQHTNLKWLHECENFGTIYLVFFTKGSYNECLIGLEDNKNIYLLQARTTEKNSTDIYFSMCATLLVEDLKSLGKDVSIILISGDGFIKGLKESLISDVIDNQQCNIDIKTIPSLGNIFLVPKQFEEAIIYKPLQTPVNPVIRSNMIMEPRIIPTIPTLSQPNPTLKQIPQPIDLRNTINLPARPPNMEPKSTYHPKTIESRIIPTTPTLSQPISSLKQIPQTSEDLRKYYKENWSSTQKAFCLAYSIDASNFSKWLRDLKNSPASERAVLQHFYQKNPDLKK